MVLADLAFVFTYASYVPYMDDWEWVPAVTGNQPVDLPWLWAQVNDHRLPLAKLLLVGLYTLADGDFRVGLYANVVCLAVLSLLMIWVAGSLRGRTSYLDVIFPLALLNIDQEIIFLGLGVNTVPAMVLAGFMLLVIVRRGTRMTLGTVVLAGGCVLLLALIGTIGLALVPALALWLGYVGAVCWRSVQPGGKRNGLVAWGFAAAGLVLVPLYFVDFTPYDQAPPSPGVWAALRTTLEYLSMSVGQAGHLGPSPASPPLVGIGVFALCLVSLAPLVRAWRTQPPERPRVLGLLSFLLAMGSLAFGIGLARSGGGLGAGYAPRYVLLATPVVYCLYLVWETYGASRLVPLGLLAGLCALFPLNVRETLQRGRIHGRRMDDVERAIEAREPPAHLATVHGGFLYDQVPADRIARYLDMLRRARIGPFRDLPEYQPPEPDDDDPVPVKVASAVAHDMTWHGGTGTVRGTGSYLLFRLARSQSVRAVRIEYSCEGAAGPAFAELFWRRSVQNDFSGGKRHARVALKTAPGEHTETVVVNDTIDEFRVHPSDKPCVFKLTEIVLLTPAAEGAYDLVVKDIREVAQRALPAGASVAVLGKDNALLRLPGRRALRFPQDEEGAYAGNPANSTQAVEYVKAARAKGAQFLLIPGPEAWWLEDYRGFKQFLDSHYPAVHRGDACIIFDLRN
jgi:hypothetical protein